MTGQLREAYRRWAGRSPLWTPLHLHHRALDAFVKERAPRVIDQAGAAAVHVLDVGCGNLPCKRFFDDPRVAAYDGADIAGARRARPCWRSTPRRRRSRPRPQATTSSSRSRCSSTRPTPRAAPRVPARLRPNGVLMLTLPFVFEYHAVPGDFRRWTTE